LGTFSTAVGRQPVTYIRRKGSSNCKNDTHIMPGRAAFGDPLEHDPEKWEPVFG
jgi:hypothetical protein